MSLRSHRSFPLVFRDVLGAKYAPEWSLIEEVKPEILLMSARSEAEKDVYFVPSRSEVVVRTNGQLCEGP